MVVMRAAYRSLCATIVRAVRGARGAASWRVRLAGESEISAIVPRYANSARLSDARDEKRTSARIRSGRA